MKEYLKTKNGILYHGDCLDVMPYLAKKNIKFDLILTDPPYGTTHCKWDSIIPFEKMWFNLNNVINDNTAICLFGSEPFSSYLRLSNLKLFKYDWVWKKLKAPNFLFGNKQPMRLDEYISTFYKKQPYYTSQLQNKFGRLSGNKKINLPSLMNKEIVKNCIKQFKHNTVPRKKLANNFLEYSNAFNGKQKRIHPTQKPVDLYKYLIKTYTKENDLILDFCAGSGTLAIACHDLNRKYIMIEKEIKYCEVIKKRMIDNNINIISKKIKLRKR